jgi:hypothetical protein
MNYLKLIPVMVAAVAPLPALAQDLSASGDRIVSDPTYLPLQGQLYGASAYGYGSTSSTATNIADGSKTPSKTTSNTLSQTLEYGLTNDLTLEVTDDYGWTHEVVSPTGKPSRDLSSNGFSDPSFGATWRVLDQRDHAPVDIDLSAAYAPDIVSAQLASPSDDGSIARGGDALRLSGAVGWESRQLTVQGYFTGAHYGAATVFDPQGAELSRSGFWQPTIGLRTQARFTDRFSLNVDGAYNFGRTTSGVSSVIAGPDQTDTGDYGSVGATLNYHFIPNRLVGSLGYTHTFYGATNVSYQLDPAADYTLDRSSDSLAVGLKYVFR